MAGIDWKTGKVVDGWERVCRAFEVLIATRKGSRIERRNVGAGIVELVDKAVSPLTIIDFYAAIVGAAEFEPCFRVKRMRTVQGDDGRPVIAIEGDYFPRALVGDFSASERKTMSLAI